jgi:hypothetical protein
VFEWRVGVVIRSLAYTWFEESDEPAVLLIGTQTGSLWYVGCEWILIFTMIGYVPVVVVVFFFRHN